jgi:outer membrane protein TolC
MRQKMIKGYAIHAVLGLILFFFPVFQTAAAGENPKGKLVLGLQEVIARVIAQNPDIRAIESDILSSKYDLEQVKGGYYPQIDTTAVVGPVTDAKEPLVVDGRITDPSPGLSFSTVGIFGRLDLTATQPLYTFGKLSNRKDAATHGVRAKEFQIEDKKAQIVLRIKELYYGLIVAQLGLDSAAEAEDFFREAENRIRRLLELKSSNVTESDLYRIDAYRSESMRFKEEARKGLRVAYFALKAMMGLPPGIDFEPVEKTLPAQKQDLSALNSYIDSAALQRPEFKQLAEALSAQDAMVKAAISDRYPSLFAAFIASLAGAPGRDTLDNPYIRDEFNHAYAGFIAGAKWNIDFGISKAKVEKARAEYNKLFHTKRSAEMNIPIQVAKSYHDHIEYGEALRFYQNAATAARKWVITAMADFDMGIETADAMLRAIEKYGQTQGSYIEALYKYNLTMAELELAAGMKTW